MITRTATQLRKNLEAIIADNAKRLEAIRRRIEDREKAGRNFDDLSRELGQARAAAEASEKLAERHLREAEAREDDNAKVHEANMRRMATESDQKLKTRAARVWANDGGLPQDFEKAWPAMLSEIRQSAVIRASVSSDIKSGIITSI